jgi:hypothetical protein
MIRRRFVVVTCDRCGAEDSFDCDELGDPVDSAKHFAMRWSAVITPFSSIGCYPGNEPETICVDCLTLLERAEVERRERLLSEAPF